VLPPSTIIFIKEVSFFSWLLYPIELTLKKDVSFIPGNIEDFGKKYCFKFGGQMKYW
jgi:hypothetical protein